MAWLDDRAWCHPKLCDLSDRAWRVYVSGIAYCSGMGTKGVLTPGQQKMLGSSPKILAELLAAELWDEAGDGAVSIHDWDEHNGRRDARRAKDRERKKRDYWERKKRGVSAGEKAEKRTEKREESRALTGDRVTEELLPENGSSSSLPRTAARNPVWDALTEVFGEATTETARSRRGKVCRSLTRAGATHDEIVRRARLWPQHFDDATFTETALEKHWDALGRKPLRAGGR